MNSWIKLLKIIGGNSGENMKIVETIRNYVRVLKITKKPGWGDFSDTARICLIGMSVVGIIGFLLYILFILVPL